MLSPPPAASRPPPDLALGHIDRLPTLPAVATRLLEIVTDRESSARDLVAILRNDQSITAKILSVASSVGAAARQVKTLEQAIPLLGYAAIRSIVLSTTIFEIFRAQEAQPSGAFDRREFWLHSVAVACAAKRLATNCPQLKLEPESCYVAGLLHDLGKVALDAVYPKAYSRIAQQALEQRCDIADLERATLGVDHTRAGRRLAEQWRLPAELRDVIWLHHLASDGLPTAVASPALVLLVQLADTLVREQRIGFSGNFVFFERSARLAEQLGISGAQLEQTIQVLLSEATEQAAQLGLENESPEARYVKAMGQANAELGRMNTELAVSNRRLAAAALYFQAISSFDKRIGAQADLSTVVSAAAEAAILALQVRFACAFGLYRDADAIEIAWHAHDETSGREALSNAAPELRALLNRPLAEMGALIGRVPPELRRTLALLPCMQDRGITWFAPIWENERCVGGLLLPGTEASPPPLEHADQFQAFLNSLGLALSRANAQHEARRLTDDLAETNRRLQHMQAELLRSRTLSMIAEMAAGAGHELNSPLTVISGRAQMLAQQIEDPDQRRSLALIRDKAHECSRIVTELMDFARPRPPQFTTVDLPALLRKCCDDCTQLTGFPRERISIEERSPCDDAPDRACNLQGDPAQLAQLFTEILSNAVAAMQDRDGAIQISFGPAAATDGYQVDVRDQGAGIPPGIQERVFDPFFSFQQAGRRRGLGLARAFRTVETHRGRIWIESEPGEGTAVHVILPRAQPT